jgi:hypothetical protein
MGNLCNRTCKNENTEPRIQNEECIEVIEPSKGENNKKPKIQGIPRPTLVTPSENTHTII